MPWCVFGGQRAICDGRFLLLPYRLLGCRAWWQAPYTLSHLSPRIGHLALLTTPFLDFSDTILFKKLFNFFLVSCVCIPMFVDVQT